VSSCSSISEIRGPEDIGLALAATAAGDAGGARCQGRQGVATGHRLRRQGRQPRPATQVARMETPKVPDEACGPSRSLHGGRIAEDRAGVLRWRAPPSKKRFRRYGVDQRIFSYFEGPLTL